MHFREDEEIFGCDAYTVRKIAQTVDSLEWASDGVLAALTGLNKENLMRVTEQLDENGFLTLGSWGVERYPDQFLPEEKDSSDITKLWHVTSNGKALAKAFIGVPLNRSNAASLLESTCERIVELMHDPGSRLQVVEVHLCGSFMNPELEEFGDLDLLVRVLRDHSCSVESKREFEELIRDGNEQLDIMVYDQHNWPYPVAFNSKREQLLPPILRADEG